MTSFDFPSPGEPVQVYPVWDPDHMYFSRRRNDAPRRPGIAGDQGEGVIRDPISRTTLLLTRAILRYGEGRLAEELGMSPTEMCRKVNNQNGFTLAQIGEVIDTVGLVLQQKSDDTVCISIEEYEGLKVLAGKYCGGRDG